MKHRRRLAAFAAFLLGSSLLAALAADRPPPAPAAPPNPAPPSTSAPDVLSPRVLVFSKTAGFRHDSIADGVAAIAGLGERHRFEVVATEDAAAFTDAGLANYDVVVFLNTTGDVLDARQEHAFEEFIRRGGGFVGVHAATDTEFNWTWYAKLVGAQFASHPAIQIATIDVGDRDHASTRHLPAKWTRTDEWYDFRKHPSEQAGGALRILATLDQASYQGGAMTPSHPVIWCQEFDGGRAWYTALGHTKESYTEEAFLKSLLGGIQWAAGDGDGDGDGDG